MWCLYFLKSESKNWYYVGSTNRLNERVREHNSGKVRSMKLYRPLLLVYTEEFNSEEEARSREQEIKKKRIAKEHIIRQIKKHWGVV